MNNYQAPRKTPAQRAIFRRRARRVMLRIQQRWARCFFQRMLDRKRYWEARRRMAGHPEMTLGQGRVKAFLDELRRAA